jgi:hypothetical protein
LVELLKEAETVKIDCSAEAIFSEVGSKSFVEGSEALFVGEVAGREAGVADGVVGEGEMVGREDEDHFDIVEWLEDEGRGET